MDGIVDGGKEDIRTEYSPPRECRIFRYNVNVDLNPMKRSQALMRLNESIYTIQVQRPK